MSLEGLLRNIDEDILERERFTSLEHYLMAKAHAEKARLYWLFKSGRLDAYVRPAKPPIAEMSGLSGSIRQHQIIREMFLAEQARIASTTRPEA